MARNRWIDNNKCVWCLRVAFANQRAAEFMAGIRARAAALDAVQASKCHQLVTNPISTIQPLPHERPAACPPLDRHKNRHSGKISRKFFAS